ncbi:MAG TPA: hypothetical protein VFX33_08205 [Actinomycetales bacterium]|nr:hypothetical protein [Actinomycetales bacterium]
MDADVVPVPGAGVAAVLLPGTDPAAAVADLSRVLRQAGVLLLVREQGQVRAERWRGGALQDTPPAGLLLSGLPDVLESLLLGGARATEYPGVVSSAGMGRIGAFKAMWRAARSRGTGS